MTEIPITLPTGLCLTARCEIYSGSYDFIDVVSSTGRPVSFEAIGRVTGISAGKVAMYVDEAIQDALDAQEENAPYERGDILQDYFACLE
jgi:hypothetical protein